MQNHTNLISSTFQIIEGKKIYSFNQCLNFIELQGKKLFGRNFQIYPEDLSVLYRLLIYAIKDEKNALKLRLDLEKGILLSGPIGCGKTSVMHLIKPFFVKASDYKIITCREIAFDFAKKGYEALAPYTQKTGFQPRIPGYCFDDFGAEQQIKHFGNDCNVMAEILLTRYEDFVAHRCITHLTTNLSASEIETHYGNRLRSRMRSLFNVIAYEPHTKDKR